MTVKWGVYCYTMGHFDQEKSKIGQRKSEENLRICFLKFCGQLVMYIPLRDMGWFVYLNMVKPRKLVVLFFKILTNSKNNMEHVGFRE